MESKIINFYLGKMAQPNTNKTIEEIWNWDDSRLEGIPNYITWLFPTRKQAVSIDWDPITTPEIQEFHNNEELRRRLLVSLSVMLKFYGFSIEKKDSKIRIGRSEDFDKKSEKWVTPNNQNYRRLSRILQSLMLLGFKELAIVFLEALMGVYNEKYKIIGTETYEFWTLSVTDEKYWNGKL